MSLPVAKTIGAAHGPREQAVEALHVATAIYTAAFVVDELLDQVDWPCGSARLVDPSAGDGMFLGRALERLFRAEPDLTPERLLDQLEAWEVHPGAASQARARVRAVLRAHGWSESQAQSASAQVVHKADFLTQGPPPGQPRYDVIVGNPPYLRALNVPALLRSEYEGVTPDYARADLLHSFLDRCARLLDPQGVVAMVTADRWLYNMNAARLRERLGELLHLRHVERLDPRSTFYRPKDRRQGTPPRVHPVVVVLGPRGDGPRQLGREAVYPDAQRGTPPATHTLADVATVRQGPWLGTRGIFLVDEQVAARLPAEHLVPAVGPRDVRDGRIGPIRRWAIRTNALDQPPPSVLAHLDATLGQMAARGRRTPRWLPPESWGPLPYDRPCLMIRRIAKRLEPVRLPAGVLATNHDVTVVASAPGWSLDRIEALLALEQTQQWVAAHAPSVDNGYRSMTTTLLRQIPVPEAVR